MKIDDFPHEEEEDAPDCLEDLPPPSRGLSYNSFIVHMQWCLRHRGFRFRFQQIFKMKIALMKQNKDKMPKGNANSGLNCTIELINEEICLREANFD